MAEKSKARPRTGDKRATNQPLKIDKLPIEVQDHILFLKNTRGCSFETIEEYSALPVRSGSPGFVDWDKLAPKVQAQFPQRRIPHTNLHRFHDLRFAQVQRDLQERSRMAREIANAFSRSVVEGGDEAVLSAARDACMAALSEDMTAVGRQRIVKMMLGLAEVQQTARSNDIKERKVAVEERKLKAFEAREKAAQERLKAESAKLKKKASKGQVTQEDVDRLFGRVFALPPRVEAARKAAA